MGFDPHAPPPPNYAGMDPVAASKAQAEWNRAMAAYNSQKGGRETAAREEALRNGAPQPPPPGSGPEEMAAFEEKTRLYKQATEYRPPEMPQNEFGYERLNAAEFGGMPGGAEFYRDIALEDRKKNDAAQAAAQGSMDYGIGQMLGPDRHVATENATMVGREAAARGQQGNALDMSMKAALGGAPSEAQSKTTQALNGLAGSVATTQGGARGLSALTGAGLGGSAVGQSAGGIANQGGFGRSQEITQAMGEYGGLAGSARGQDLSRLAQNSQNSNAYADLNDQWRVGQGQNAVNAGKLGNALESTDQARYGASMQPMEAQFQADQAMKGIEQGANADKGAISYAKNVDKRKSDKDLYMGLATTAGTAAGTMMGGPVGGMAAGSAVQGIGGSYR